MNWRLALKPKWILGHLIILAVVVLFLYLSQWQFHRLDGRKQANAAVKAASAKPPLTINSAELPPGAEKYRNVTATGTWRNDLGFYVRYPLLDGATGYYVVTPLAFDNGAAVLVNRGWIPVDAGKSASLAPTGSDRVTITGFLQDFGKASKAPGSTTGAPGVPTFTSIDRQQLSRIALPMPATVVQLSSQSPAEAGGPRPLPPPELDEGSHFSYALQWIAFAIVGLIGWAILVTRAIREPLSTEHG